MTSININFWYKLIRIDLFIFNDFHWLISEKTFKSHLVEVQDVVCTVLFIMSFSHDSMQFFRFIDKILKENKNRKKSSDKIFKYSSAFTERTCSCSMSPYLERSQWCGVLQCSCICYRSKLDSNLSEIARKEMWGTADGAGPDWMDM